MPPDLVDHAAGLLTQDERPSAKVHGEGASGIAAPAEGPLNCASSAAVSLAFTSTSLTNGRKHLTYRTGVTHERAPERFNGLFGTTLGRLLGEGATGGTSRAPLICDRSKNCVGISAGYFSKPPGHVNWGQP